MDTKNFVLASLVLLSFAGCGDAPDAEDSTAELRLPGACGNHGGRYIVTIGTRISGDDGCLYRPVTEDVILPPSTACTTNTRADYHLVIDPRIAISDVIRCTWSRTGSHADCVLDEFADEGQASCSAGYAMTYDRVSVVAW